MIKIIIADNEEIVLVGLTSLIKSIDDIEVVGIAKNDRELLSILNETAADIVIMDIENGTETTVEISEKFPHIKVLVYTRYNDIRDINGFIDAGAKGYILKNKPKEELIKAIKTIYYDDKKYFGEDIKEALFERLTNPAKNGGIKLTEREIEVLKLICKGFSTRQIAGKLYIEPNTVSTHRRSLMQKTGARNSIQLMVFAIEAGYIDLTDL